MAKKKKKKAKRVRKSRAKGRRKPKRKARRPVVRRKTSKLVSRAVAGPAKAPTHRKRARAVATRNPASEHVVEAYMPKGRKFFYYAGDNRLTAKRADAARYRSVGEARKQCLVVKNRAPRGIDWVRVCPA